MHRILSYIFTYRYKDDRIKHIRRSVSHGRLIVNQEEGNSNQDHYLLLKKVTVLQNSFYNDYYLLAILL